MQYTEEQITRANQTDLVSFLNAQGTPNACYILIRSEGAGAKVRVREEKNPDHQLRSPNNS